MRRLFVVLLIITCVFSSLWAQDQKLVGVWESTDGKNKYEILDGFKPNSGAVLAIESGVETELGSWNYTNGTYSMSLGWYSDDVTFITEDVIEYKRESFTRAEDIIETGIVSIKTDEQAFIDTLTASSWLDGENGNHVLFRTTFSSDSGVQERFAVDSTFSGFESWAIGSGVLKIGSTTFIDTRVSDRYLIGLDQYDDFVVYKCLETADSVNRTTLKEERESFLASLTTDEWYTVGYYSSPTIHRFRPIESELKGRVIQTKDDKLYSWNIWEYSPDTGTIKIGYTTFIGAIVLGDTIAFIDNSGDQTFYRRKPGGDNYRFTVSDVINIPLSESNNDKISTILEGNFQSGDYIYSFEFFNNKLDGYVHKFNSEPFKIIGNRFTNNLIGNSERLWAVEDVVIFDERNLLKRNTQKVRLKSISDEESEMIQQLDKNTMQSFMEKNIKVRVKTTDGQVLDVELPIADFSEIANITLLIE